MDENLINKFSKYIRKAGPKHRGPLASLFNWDDVICWVPSEVPDLTLRFVAVGGCITIFSIILICMMWIRRNKQPLKKKSAKLIIVSVIGNILCLLNIVSCMTWFERFKD